MKKLKTQKGITLVALIITIVVLLILAVVAIGAVQESKIIGHSQNAAGSFNQAKANEVGYLTSYEETINKYVPGETKVTGKAYGTQTQFFIMTSDDRMIVVQNNAISFNLKIEYLENLIVTDKNGVVLEDMNFQKFFKVGEIAIMALSGNTIYNLEQFENEGNYTYKIESSYEFNEAIDVSEYLK